MLNPLKVFMGSSYREGDSDLGHSDVLGDTLWKQLENSLLYLQVDQGW